MNTLQVLLLSIVAIALLASIVASRPRGRKLTALGNALGDGTKRAWDGDHSIVLEAAVPTIHLLLRKGTAANGALLGTATDRPFGFAEDEGAIGDTIAMHRLGYGGRSVLGIASAAIAADDRLSPAASGKLRTLPVATGTYWVVGTAVTAGSGDGDIFELIPCTPFQVVIP